MERKDWKGQYKMVKLNEVCRASSSNIILKNIKEKTGDYPVYGASGYIQNIDSYHCNEPYIGIIKDGAGVGKVEIYPAYSSLLGTMQYIHASEKVDLRYIYYKLRSLDFTQYINGAAIPHIYFKDYGQEIIPVPPLPVQARIVDELDCLQGILSKKRQQLAEYHSLAQAIFHQMFGDPVVNEKGWEVKRLGEVCDTHSGGTPNKSHREYYEGGNIPWLRSGEVAQLYIKNCELYITPEGLNNSSALLFPQDTVVIAMYGATAGQVGILKKGMTTNQAVCGIFPTPTFVPEFLYYTFLCIKQDLVSKAIGNAQPNISQTTIRNTLLPIPPLPLQQSFANRIAVINNQCENLNKSIHEMETLLATRMDKLLNID